jgi:hypothetical protein
MIMESPLFSLFHVVGHVCILGNKRDSTILQNGGSIPEDKQ